MVEALGQSGGAGVAAGVTFQNAAMTVMVLSLLVMAIWLVRVLANPSALSLSQTPNRPNSVNPLHLLAIIAVWFGAQFVATHAYLNATGQEFPPAPPPGDEPDPNATLRSQLNVIAGLTGQPVLLAAAMVAAAMTFRLGFQRGLGLSMRHWFYDGLRGIVGLAVLLPMVFGVLLATNVIIQPYFPDLVKPHALLEAAKNLALPWKIATVFSAVVLAPLAEEIFFRGLMQSMFRKYLSRPWVAIFATSAIFAALHPVNTIPALLVLSLGLGYVYERSGRLVGPILMHALFNGINMSLLFMA